MGIVGSSLSKIYTTLNSLGIQLTNQVVGSVYSSMANFFQNIFVQTCVLLIICIWLLNRLKTGMITKDDVFSAGKWVILYVLISVIYSSPSAYNELKSWLMLPQKIVYTAMSGAGINTSNAGNKLGELMGKPFDNVWDVYIRKYKDNFGKTPNEEKFNSFTGIDGIIHYYEVCFFDIGFFFQAITWLIACALIFLVCVGYMITLTICNFTVQLYSSFIAVFLFLALTPQTRTYFTNFFKIFVAVQCLPAMLTLPLILMGYLINKIGSPEEIEDSLFSTGCMVIAGIAVIHALNAKMKELNEQLFSVQIGGGFGTQALTSTGALGFGLMGQGLQKMAQFTGKGAVAGIKGTIGAGSAFAGELAKGAATGGIKGAAMGAAKGSFKAVSAFYQKSMK